jgi:hypothetical protein
MVARINKQDSNMTYMMNEDELKLLDYNKPFSINEVKKLLE